MASRPTTGRIRGCLRRRPDSVVQLVRGTQHVDRLGVGRRAPASARSSAGHARAERDEAAQLLLRDPARRPRPSPGCFTPTRIRATSGSRRTAASASSTSSGQPAARTGCRRSWGGCSPPALRAAPTQSSPASERRLRRSRRSRWTLSGCSRYLEPFIAPLRSDEFTFSAALAPKRLRPHQRPEAAELRARLQAQPATAVSAHPPRLEQRHRCAQPARGDGPREETVDAFLPGRTFLPSATSPALPGQTTQTTTECRMPLGQRPAERTFGRHAVAVDYHQLGIELALDGAEVVATALLRTSTGATPCSTLRLQVSRAVAWSSAPVSSTRRAGEQRSEFRRIGLRCHGRGLPRSPRSFESPPSR